MATVPRFRVTPAAERDDETDPDSAILDEAKRRFKRVQDWESDFRNLYVMDVKFANADSDNGWQWPHDLRRDREVNKRPALTINKVAPLVALITNDSRQNQPSISIKPVGDEASFEAAQIYEGLVRHIEYVSGAQSIYDEAFESQVEGGIGYWRVVTGYVDDDTFDQDVQIEAVRSHLGVFLDCDIKRKDGLDAKYGFIFDEYPRVEFEDEYPDVDVSGDTGLDEAMGWSTKDTVRVAEYYRLLETDDELIHLEDDAGNAADFRRSDVPDKWRKELLRAEKDGKGFKKRKIRVKTLEWFKIAGNKIIARRDGKSNQPLRGSYVPIVRCVGKERIIEGRLERKGHVRTLKDAQRMYNYNTSAQVEYGALATKSPWVGPEAAFAGNTKAWDNSNRSNAAYLTFKHLDPDGNPIPAPTRPDAPGTSPAFLEGMRIASSELDMASGQQPAQQGAPGNEKSGRAIAERQRQGDTITYHFIDNQALAIRATGKIILDLVPHTYDTERVIQILGKDGTNTKVTIKPDQDTAMEEQKEKDQILVAFNPKKGKYEVEADVGPAYSTQRQEAWNAFVQIATASPAFMDEFGDMMFFAADFPNADKIAERFRKKLQAEKPYLFDDNAPTPAQQQLNQQIQQQSEQIAELLQQLAEMRLKLKGKEQLRDIEAFDAHTKRLTAEGNVVADFQKLGDNRLIERLKALIKQTEQQAGSYDLGEVEAPDDGGWPPTQQQQGQQLPGEESDDPQMRALGARRAPDGRHYVPHPGAPGKYMRVDLQPGAPDV